MIIKRFVTGIATAAIVSNLFALTAFADTNVTISGNGANSDNNAEVSNSNTTVITQSNSSVVGTVISSDANTGDNTANGNNKGDVTITTGEAKNRTKVNVQTGSNDASVTSCCGCEGNTTLDINGNGNKSDNTAKVNTANTTVAQQTNSSKVWTILSNKSNTGGNKANNNNQGNVSITSGNAKNKTKVRVQTGGNSLETTACCGACNQAV
jgi:hypothetical protein